MTKQQVEAVIERIRPFLQADGGDIEVVDVNGHSADVKLTGMCAGCPSAHMTLYLGVEPRCVKRFRSSKPLRVV
jgi:Fe-S cluster biogenesis protein NfuA